MNEEIKRIEDLVRTSDIKIGSATHFEIRQICSDLLSQLKHKSIDLSQAPKFEGYEPIAFRCRKQGEIYYEPMNNKLYQAVGYFNETAYAIYQDTSPKETQQEQPKDQDGKSDRQLKIDIDTMANKLLKEQHTDKGDDIGGWYCVKCKCLVQGKNVTYEETHDGCGGECIGPPEQSPQQPQEIKKLKTSESWKSSVEAENVYEISVLLLEMYNKQCEIIDRLNTITGRE